jgi:hypothetical protein
MARPKGFKLSAEQKARMQAGRKAAKAKTLDDAIPVIEKVKKNKGEVQIIGYTKDIDGSILPVFDSEKGLYKGKIYKTSQEARESRE